MQGKGRKRCLKGIRVARVGRFPRVEVDNPQQFSESAALLGLQNLPATNAAIAADDFAFAVSIY